MFSAPIKPTMLRPLIVNDRTMLPARFVCENLGAEVTWDSVQKQVIITGKHLKTGADLRIVITIGASTATVNNQTVALDAPLLSVITAPIRRYDSSAKAWALMLLGTAPISKLLLLNKLH